MHKLIATLSSATALLLCQSALADDWPTQPVKMVVGYSAGGTTDLIARTLSEPIAAALGKAVIIENRSGAGGSIGTASVVNAAPDGYTLLFAASPEIAIAPAIGVKTAYDVQKDLKPVGLVCIIPHMLVVNKSVPVKTVDELRALAKSKPGELNFASYGTGTSNHLTAELFKAETGLDITHIPFKGSAPAMIDLLAGRVHMTFDTEAAVLKHVQSGDLVALGLAHDTRSHVLPSVPTMAEANIPNFQSGSWVGVLAPAGTPDSITQHFNKVLNETLKSESMQKRLRERGLSYCPGGSPADFSEFIQNEISKWTKVAQRAHVTLE